MANQNAQTPATNAKTEPKKSFKEIYEEGITAYASGNSFAQSVAEIVLTKFSEAKKSPKIAEKMEAIKAATLAFDIQTVVTLSQELKDINDNESSDAKVVESVKKQGFQTALKAFDKEFTELAYEIAVEVQKRIHSSQTNAFAQQQSNKPGRKPKDPNAPATLPRVALAGVFKVKTKEGSEYTLEAGKKGNFSWNGYSTLLDDLGIPYETENHNNKDKIVFKEEGIAVNKDDATLYVRTIAAIVQGVQNGLYEGATVSEVKPEPAKEPEKA